MASYTVTETLPSTAETQPRPNAQTRVQAKKPSKHRTATFFKRLVKALQRKKSSDTPQDKVKSSRVLKEADEASKKNAQHTQPSDVTQADVVAEGSALVAIKLQRPTEDPIGTEKASAAQNSTQNPVNEKENKEAATEDAQHELKESKGHENVSGHLTTAGSAPDPGYPGGSTTITVQEDDGDDDKKGKRKK